MLVSLCVCYKYLTNLNTFNITDHNFLKDKMDCLSTKASVTTHSNYNSGILL